VTPIVLLPEIDSRITKRQRQWERAEVHKEQSIDELAKELENLYIKKSSETTKGTEARSARRVFVPQMFLKPVAKASTSIAKNQKNIEDQIRSVERVLLQKINSELEINGVSQQMKQKYITKSTKINQATKNTILTRLIEHFKYEPTQEDIENKLFKKLVKDRLDATLERPLLKALDDTIKALESNNSIKIHYSSSQQKAVSDLVKQLTSSKKELEQFLNSSIEHLSIQNGILYSSGLSDKEIVKHIESLKNIYSNFETLRGLLLELHRVYINIISNSTTENAKDSIKPARTLMNNFNKNIGLLLELKVFIDSMDKKMNPHKKIDRKDAFGALPLERFMLEDPNLSINQMIEKKEKAKKNKS